MGIGGTGDGVRLRLLVGGPGIWSCPHSQLLQDVVPYLGQVIPASIFVEGSLSNHFSSTSSILTLSRVMLWLGWSQFTCLGTSEFTELGLLCSKNLDFRDKLEHKRGVVRTLLHQAEAIMSDPKDLEEEEAHIKQELHWNNYLAWLLEGADMPPLDQPAEETVEENSLDSAPH